MPTTSPSVSDRSSKVQLTPADSSGTLYVSRTSCEQRGEGRERKRVKWGKGGRGEKEERGRAREIREKERGKTGGDIGIEKKRARCSQDIEAKWWGAKGQTQRNLYYI